LLRTARTAEIDARAARISVVTKRAAAVEAHMPAAPGRSPRAQGWIR
jgi:hypothetical protein